MGGRVHIVERTVLLESTPGASCELSSARPQGSRTHAARGAGEAPEGALGTYTKIAALLPDRVAVDLETGELRGFEIRSVREGWPEPQVVRSALEARANAFARHSEAQRLLWTLGENEKGQRHRTCKCGRIPLPSSEIAAMWSKQHRKAFYAGLMVCGNRWTCPLCMRKISERNRTEVLDGVDRAKGVAKRGVMGTFTLRHNLRDKLEELLVLLNGKGSAFDKFNKGKAGRLLKRLGSIGFIKAPEITYSPKNGFHPHLHVLWFIDIDAPSAAELEPIFARLWIEACRAVGIAEKDLPTLSNGCTVIEADDAGGYITKMGLGKDAERRWDIGAEMTKGGASKLGKLSGYSPLQLLDESLEGNAHAGALFLTYAKATKGVHGLRWSPNLRKKLGMTEQKSDEEVAAESEDETAEVFSRISRTGWKFIYKHGLRARLLDLIETDPDQARAFITEIELEASRVTSPVTF